MQLINFEPGKLYINPRTQKKFRCVEIKDKIDKDGYKTMISFTVLNSKYNSKFSFPFKLVKNFQEISHNNISSRNL